MKSKLRLLLSFWRGLSSFGLFEIDYDMHSEQTRIQRQGLEIRVKSNHAQGAIGFRVLMRSFGYDVQRYIARSINLLGSGE